MHIRTHLLNRAEQPVPSQETNESLHYRHTRRREVALHARHATRNRYLERPAPSSLADVIDTILDKGW